MPAGNEFAIKDHECVGLLERYIEWASKRTFRKVVYNQKTGITDEIFLPRPPTIQSFCIFQGCNEVTFHNIVNKTNDKYSDILLNTIASVNRYIKDYQISGAMLNELNPMIIARLNNIQETVNFNEKQLQAVTINVLGEGVNMAALFDNNFVDAEIVTDSIQMSTECP